jgi:hypothetical protein
MKTYMKPIKMIAWFAEDGAITPVSFQIIGHEQEYVTVPIDKIIVRNEEKLAGNKMLIFRCQSVINKLEKIYELKYEPNKCKWWLWKI